MTPDEGRRRLFPSSLYAGCILRNALGVSFKNLYFYLTLNRNMYIIQLLLQAQCSKIQGVLDIILEELTGIKDEYTHFDVKSEQSLLCKESRLVKS